MHTDQYYCLRRPHFSVIKTVLAFKFFLCLKHSLVRDSKRIFNRLVIIDRFGENSYAYAYRIGLVGGIVYNFQIFFLIFKYVLVSAYPEAAHIFPARALESFRSGFYSKISLNVTEGIVYIFQIVEVAQNERKFFSAFFGRTEYLRRKD